MPEATQFCIGLENKPGVLAGICATLSRAGVNIDALYVSGDEDCCWVNFVASPVAAAQRVLSAENHNFFTEQVVVVQVDDKPGELQHVSESFAEAGVNINYVYGSCTSGKCTLVFNVDDIKLAIKTLEG